VFLPGPNGLNVEVWRIYNSKILKDKQEGEAASVQAESKSWVGMGWTMHMGRIYDYNSANPVIEFPDGRRETLYLDNYGTAKHITRDFLKFDKTTNKLYFKNGVIWTFGLATTVYFGDGTSKPTRVVTKIENPYGHYISISYNTYLFKAQPTISKIIDSMNREIIFVSSYGAFRKLQQIKVKNYQGNEAAYNYSVGTFSNGFYKLQSFTPPGMPTSTFEYYDGSNNQYELTKVTAGYGGVLEYIYANHYFYFNTTRLDSRVVVQKKITFNPGEQAKVWDYIYPTYSAVPYDMGTVEGPEYDTNFTHYAYDVSCPWKIGLIKEWSKADGSQAETYDWTYQEISEQNWMVLGTDMGTAKGPLLSLASENNVGDSNLKTEYVYERTDTKRYGLPTKISYYVNGSVNPKSYTELTYFYESSGLFRNKYMMVFVADQTDYSGSGTALRKAATSYYEETGKWGAVKQVKKYRSPSFFYTWDYGYQCSSPNLVVITISSPGVTGTQQIKYSYGVQSEVISADGLTKNTRTISEYNSFVLSEKNQYGGTINYTYDGAGRVSYINYPAPLNDISMSWRPNGENKVIITRGGNTVTNYWDGMGRETGHSESGSGSTLYYRKTLDAEGRLKEENRGSTDPGHKYTYVLNNAGRVTQITDPMQKTSTICYAGVTKTVTDPEQHTTVYEFADLPGQVTKVTDPLNNKAIHSYDALGRLVQVDYNGGRIHSYEYDWLDNVTSETHPETGSISYLYDDDKGFLKRKTWGNSRQEYIYSESGRFSKLETYKSGILEESITYGYNSAGGIASISSTNGWSRSAITYNDWGLVIGESLSIPGLGIKTLSYTYDNNNNQSGITYPDGRTAATGYNALNMPESITFNNKSIVDAASYGPNKMPTGISVAGNGTSYSASYSSSGLIMAMSFKKGSTTLYDVAYTYDGAGNIITISSTAPAPALNATFGYDALNRLSSATYSTGRASTYLYEYDAYGNMKIARENGLAVFNKNYDDHNRIIGLTYDERGNLQSSGGNIYSWDSLNRLQYIQNTSGEIIASYYYDDRGLRLKAVPPLPEININQGGLDIPDGGAFAFKIVAQEDKTFIVENDGDANLTLGEVTISGQDADEFEVIQQPNSPVTPGSTSSFVVRFSPSSGGLKIAALSLPSNDPDENPYEITLYGNYEPEMDIIGFVDGDSYDFGELRIGDFQRMTFTIQNLGVAPLNLNGTPKIAITGPDWDSFSVEQQPASQVPAGGTTQFIIQFIPMREGSHTALLSIPNDDSDENPYEINLYGTGLIGINSITKSDDQIDLVFPDGNEKLQAGSLQTITWSGGRSRFVKIEYSADNGSTYWTIAEKTPNTGSYEWLVPKSISSSCLIRISDADGALVPDRQVISFELTFKISSPRELYTTVPRFEVNFSVPDYRYKTNASLDFEILADESIRNVYVSANAISAAPISYDFFLDRWHRLRVQFDLNSRLASIWMDNELLVDFISLKIGPTTASYGVISVSGDAGSASRIRIEDVEVKLLRPDAEFNAGRNPAVDDYWQRIFLDDFETYEGELGILEQGGWVDVTKVINPDDQEQYGGESEPIVNPSATLMKAYWAAQSEKSDRVTKTDFEVDFADSVSGLWSLAMQKKEHGSSRITKIFALPFQNPFGISERSFAVVKSRAVAVRNRADNPSTRADSSHDTYVRPRRGSTSVTRPWDGELYTKIPSQGGSAGGGEVRTFSAYPIGTYYVYTFDGRLVAEYNGAGICTRDYIYMGGKLIAEYRPLEAKYYYYATDQIGSTRIVTDDTGGVVYAAAHDPYGGIQKTWVSAYDPSLKFSGKERDTESGLDYFGARYYDHSLYRFLSVDPVIHAGSALANPQRWNLYAYCGNNPISFVDFSGAFSLSYIAKLFRVPYGYDLGSGQYMINAAGAIRFSINAILEVKYDQSGAKYLSVTIGIMMYLLDDASWKVDPFFTKSPLEVFKHEVSHWYLVDMYLRKRLAKIESDWLKGKITLEEADKRINGAYQKAKWWSKVLLDDLQGLFQFGMRYWLHIDVEWLPWRDDIFMQWVLNLDFLN